MEIKIEFDRVREFTAVHIHTSNQFTKGIQVSCCVIFVFGFASMLYYGKMGCAARSRATRGKVVQLAVLNVFGVVVRFVP